MTERKKDKRTDNTMTKRKSTKEQTTQWTKEETQTTQWTKETPSMDFDQTWYILSL